MRFLHLTFLTRYFFITLGVITTGLLLAVFLLVISVLVMVWHPKTVPLALPYLEKLTAGQLQVESATGTLAEGLSLQNIRFNHPELNVQIAQVDWQWQWSALWARRLHLQALTLTQPRVQIRTGQPSAQDDDDPQPFAILTQLMAYKVRFDIDRLTITQAQWQFDDEPPLAMAQFNSVVNWQGQTLQLSDLNADYDTYKLQASGRFEVLNAAEFSADLTLNLSGFDGFESIEGIEGLDGIKAFDSIKVSSQASGGLKRIKFSLDLLAPITPLTPNESYALRSEHVLTIEGHQIQLDSQLKHLAAPLTENWQVMQLQGHNALSYHLDSAMLSNIGQLNLALANKPAVNLEYTTHYANDGTLNFNVNTFFEQMGSLATQGQVNVPQQTLNAKVQTEKLNLLWLDPSLNYQISTVFDVTLNDFEKAQGQLNIDQLTFNGLPEPLAFKGTIELSHTATKATKAPTASANAAANANDYAVSIKSSQLAYADYSGQLQATVLASQDFKRFEVARANLVVGDNVIDVTGQWAETLNLSINAQLNQLNQLYAPLSGRATASVISQGTLLSDLSGFNQAWSTVKVTASDLRYQTPDAVNAEAFTLKNLAINGRIPLHDPALSTLNVSGESLQQTSNTDTRLWLSHLQLQRQASHQDRSQSGKNGLSTQLTLRHPELTLTAELHEDKPSLQQQTLVLSKFAIEHANTHNAKQSTHRWALDQPKNIVWTSPARIKSEQICVRSVDKEIIKQSTTQSTTQAGKLCLQAHTDYAEWSMQDLPVLDWLTPWLSDSLVLNGTLTGQGSANWQQALTLKQTLLMPKLNITLIEQGHEIPLVVEDWQTELHFSQTQASLKSNARINDSGYLHADVVVKNKPHQAWSNATLNGHVQIALNEWSLNERIAEFVKLNKAELNIDSTLSGTVATWAHITHADIDLNVDLPLLGLSRQAIALQAQLTPETILANGVWKQHENQTDETQANLSLTLTELSTQPVLMASLKTDSMALLKTPFAHLKTAADMTVTLENGRTHVQGKAQLHDSQINLDEMPLHEGIATSHDEIIIDEQGQVVVKSDAASNLTYDITIGFGKNVQVNVRDSQLVLGGELQLAQGLNERDMKAFGEVKITKGYINLDARNQIQIDQSGFIFNGQLDNPTLNVNLYRVVDQTTARLNITGNATQPQFVFYSTPALSQGRIINLMVFGRAGDMSNEPNYQSQVLSAFYKLGIQNNTPVLNTLTSTLGIQDVYLDVQGQQVSSLLVGRALTDKLYVRYAKDLTGQQNNAVQFFYQLTQRWLLKTNSGDNNSSVDLIYRLER